MGERIGGKTGAMNNGRTMMIMMKGTGKRKRVGGMETEVGWNEDR